MAKTAMDKIAEEKPAKIINDLPAGAASWAVPGASMVVSSPKEVNALMNEVPEGKLATSETLRGALAKRYKTDITCPMSTGIFINIAARASEEMDTIGMPSRTAWWRTVKADGQLLDKAPGGMEKHKSYLEAEGHEVKAKGKKLFVANLDTNLVDADQLLKTG